MGRRAQTGFVAEQMTVNAEFANANGWETAPMSRVSDDAFSFVFVGVTEELEYYTSVGRLNSSRHVIRVASGKDLPSCERP